MNPAVLVKLLKILKVVVRYGTVLYNINILLHSQVSSLRINRKSQRKSKKQRVKSNRW